MVLLHGPGGLVFHPALSLKPLQFQGSRSTCYLYDKPYDDKKVVRVAGPFTVESLSPHRVLGVDENDELIDPLAVKEANRTTLSDKAIWLARCETGTGRLRGNQRSGTRGNMPNKPRGLLFTLAPNADVW